MKLILKPSLVAVLILAVFIACAKKQTSDVGLRSLGNITVNGPGLDGNVHAGTKVLFTLKEIHENQNYTLRTEIALTSVGSLTADGTLTADIYKSADAFRNDPASPMTSAVALPAPNSNIYEVNFIAESSGDYVVVLSGESKSVPGIQFFYNLRLMSADRTVDPAVVTNFTSTIIPALDEHLANPLNPGFLTIYNGGDLSSSGTFSISLVSNATTTIANPQMFIYLNSKLTITSLMLSSIPTSTDFVVTRFNAGVPDSDNAERRDINLISQVTFTSRADTGDPVGGPFIVLKGFVSAVTYTLSIGP